MQVTLLTQVVPNPPDAGPRVKTHYVLRTLAQDHDVDLITFVRDAREEAAAAELLTFCRSVTTIPLRRARHLEPWYLVRGWARRQPFLVSRDYRSAFMDAVSERIASGRVDVLHADQVSMAQYLGPARGHTVATVFDAHNAVWQLVRSMSRRQPTPLHRLAAAIEWRMMRHFEQSAASAVELTLAVNVNDLLDLTGTRAESATARVIPIGVEVRDVVPVAGNEAGANILSVATMHYPPNAEAIRWFANDIWPAIRQASPGAQVDIVGPRPPADIVSWGESDARVAVHGYVDDLGDAYRRAAVFIVPLQAGSGVRVKVLEAMARGVCVVSTSLGIDGLDLVDGEHVVVADSASEFAAAVTGLLEDPERRASIACNARDRVLDLYDWRSCCRPVLEAYRDLHHEPELLDEKVALLSSETMLS